MSYHPQPNSRRAQALEVIRAHPRGIRSAELAAALGIPTKQVHASVAPLIHSGEVVACKVTTDAGETVEFRTGAASGTPMPRGESKAFTINAKRAAGNPIVPRPREEYRAAEGRLAELAAGAPAVAAQIVESAAGCSFSVPLAPSGTGKVRRISLDADARLSLHFADGDLVVTIAPESVLALGDFLHATEGVWRP